MSGLPIRDRQFKTADFLAWLARNGAEIGTPTNRYEVVRYRAYETGARKAATHIVYAKETGLLTWTGSSMDHYRVFLAGGALPDRAMPADQPVAASPASETSGVTARRRKRIMQRDGSDCWFCGKPLGDDETLEHLVPQSRGGGNDSANCVLAHAVCNQKAANLSLSEKVELRSQLRRVMA